VIRFSVSGDGVVYEDAAGVWWAHDVGGEAELVAADACEPRVLSHDPRTIGLFSPCATRHLVLYQPDRGARTDVAADIVWYSPARLGDLWVFYTTGPRSTGDVGELWALDPAGRNHRIGERAPWRGLDVIGDERALVTIRDDELGTWDPDRGFELIRAGVRESSLALSLSHPRLLARTDDDTLLVIDPAGLDVELEVPGVELYEAAWKFPLVAYVVHGTLHAWSIPTGDTTVVDTGGVRDIHEVNRPGNGLLYTRDGVDGAGLYLAPVVAGRWDAPW
jgi:hypothetical protein